jgi:hypothetical protein
VTQRKTYLRLVCSKKQTIKIMRHQSQSRVGAFYEKLGFRVYEEDKAFYPMIFSDLYWKNQQN